MNVRTKVRWPVVFRRRNGESLETTTENLSSRGFYCLSQTPIARDELLVCWLTMPTHDPSGAFGTALLEKNPTGSNRVRIFFQGIRFGAGFFRCSADFRINRLRPSVLGKGGSAGLLCSCRRKQAGTH